MSMGMKPYRWWKEDKYCVGCGAKLLFTQKRIKVHQYDQQTGKQLYYTHTNKRCPNYGFWKKLFRYWHTNSIHTSCLTEDK